MKAHLAKSSLMSPRFWNVHKEDHLEKIVKRTEWRPGSRTLFFVSTMAASQTSEVQTMDMGESNSGSGAENHIPEPAGGNLPRAGRKKGSKNAATLAKEKRKLLAQAQHDKQGRVQLLNFSSRALKAIDRENEEEEEGDGTSGTTSLTGEEAKQRREVEQEVLQCKEVCHERDALEDDAEESLFPIYEIVDGELRNFDAEADEEQEASMHEQWPMEEMDQEEEQLVEQRMNQSGPPRDIDQPEAANGERNESNWQGLEMLQRYLQRGTIPQDQRPAKRQKKLSAEEKKELLEAKAKEILEKKLDVTHMTNLKKDWDESQGPLPPHIVHGDPNTFIPFNINSYKASLRKILPTMEKMELPSFYFGKFMPKNLFEDWRDNTNAYAMWRREPQQLERYQKGKMMFSKPHKTITLGEIYRFVGILIWMGTFGRPEIDLHWEQPFKDPIIAQAMSRDRFWYIKACFAITPHFGGSFYSKVSPLVSTLNNNFMANRGMNYLSSLDEGVVPFKGKSIDAHNQGRKPKAYGFKSYVIADPESGYVHQLRLHIKSDIDSLRSRSDFIQQNLTVTAKVVVCLARDARMASGQVLVMDNFYNTPALANELRAMGIGLLGTARRNFIPQVLNTAIELSTKTNKTVKNEVREFVYEGINYVLWHDSKEALLMDTVFGPIQERYDRKARWERPTQRLMPQQFHAYNDRYYGVDLVDQFITYYNLNNRQSKYWWPVFLWCIQLAMSNAFVVYRDTMASNGFQRRKMKGRLQWYSELATSLIEEGQKMDPYEPGRGRKIQRPKDNYRYSRYGHQLTLCKVADPDRCPFFVEKNPSERMKCTMCRQRFNTNRSTYFWCLDCCEKPGKGVPLCPYCTYHWHKDMIHGNDTTDVRKLL